MNNRWLTLRKYSSFAALSVAIIALPFSVKLCHAGIIIFLIIWLTEGGWHEKSVVLKKSILVQILAAFTVLQCIGIGYTEDLTNGWLSIEKKIFLFTVPVALATTSIKFQQKEVFLMLYLFVTACFIGTVVCMLNAAHQANLVAEGTNTIAHFDYLTSSDFRKLNPMESEQWLMFSYIALAQGINIHPTYFSIYLAFCILFLLYRLETNNRFSTLVKIMHWSFIAYFSLLIVLLSSRIAVISLLLIFAFEIVKLLRQRLTRVASIGLFVLVSLLCLFLYTNPVSRYRNWQEITITSLHISPNNIYRNSTDIRASLWWLAAKSFTRINPVWGAGTGDVKSVMQQTGKEYNITNTIGSHDPHNQYLYVLLGHGVIGLILFLAILGLAAYIAWIHRDAFSLSFLFLFAALCFTESALELQKGIVFFTLFFPLLAFQLRPYQTLSLATKQSIRARS